MSQTDVRIMLRAHYLFKIKVLNKKSMLPRTIASCPGESSRCNAFGPNLIPF